ncbi:hypothetical protein [Parasitella parasitica]|uniref:Tc1-like transposase DDE domain-containing protein n=1 Tax=Parasitella parasitica TaxID=35722 RepID=A0A0B7N9S0_9FUNG|nr:hypothetical protein [Parasitella parasitica]
MKKAISPTILWKMIELPEGQRFADTIGRELVIESRTAQRCWKSYLETSEVPLKKTTKNRGRPSNFTEEHKAHVLDLVDNDSQVTVMDVVESLTKSFEDVSLTKSAAHRHMNETLYERITLGPKSQNVQLSRCLKQVGGWAEKRYQATITADSTGAVSYTSLGAIPSKFAVSIMELRNPQKEWSKRIKIDFYKLKSKAPPSNNKPLLKGTVTGHYLVFLEKTMDEIDCLPEMEGYYIAVDNVFIHAVKEIDELITRRGYKPFYLPPCSPELNPVEQFWVIVKNNVKCSKFED